ncbi:MAG: cyclic nucleotide-binding protein [Gammaproteobacteria bacterium]
MSFPDLLGLIGVALILIAYAMLQTNRWAPTARRFSALNALGAGLILVSLGYDFNLPAVVIESCWLLISLYGLFRHSRTKVDMK